MWVRDKLGFNSMNIFNCIFLLSELLILCNCYKIPNYAIDYTNFKSIAFVFIPLLSQSDTYSLDSRFYNESVCIANILGVSLNCVYPLQNHDNIHYLIPARKDVSLGPPDSLVSKYWLQFFI